VRIDDLSNPEAAVALWAGTASATPSSRVLSLELAQPRTISRVRVVLQTNRVAGWNQIDAVGLVPKQ
jgi:hypothetical protein